MEGNSNFFSVNPIEKSTAFNTGITEETKYHRLNGYDSSLLNESTPQGNEKVNLEYKITEKLTMLNDINGKIKNAEIYGTQTEVLSLKVRKQRLEKELFELNRQQADTIRLNKNLTGEIIDIPWLRKVQNFISRNILAKVSKKFNSIVFLGDSLEKLVDINKNVDALIEVNVPYGEMNDNYEKLTNYLSKANKIHMEISKTMRK